MSNDTNLTRPFYTGNTEADRILFSNWAMQAVPRIKIEETTPAPRSDPSGDGWFPIVVIGILVVFSLLAFMLS